MKSILKKLQDDKHYYGAYGKQYLSNSNIGTLLTNPKEHGRPQKETLPMVQGRYFHVSMLEPEKLSDFEIIDASTRSTKIYKDQANGRLLLLRKEVDKLDKAIAEMKASTLSQEIYSEGTQYEVPIIGEFFGVEFKGKADIITKETLQMKVFTCSEEFLLRGREKVERAVAIWNRFFKDGHTEDVSQYIAEEVL